MRLRPASRTTVVGIVIGLTTATVGLTSVPAQADGTTPLPLSHYAHMLVDAKHQQIFFTEGSGSTAILVTDLSGHTLTSVPNEAGATGLALSADGDTVYAALADGDAIAAIHASSRTESARYPTGSGSRPASVAVAGGKVWYGYQDADTGGIGNLDPAAADPVATPVPGLSHWSHTPLLGTGSGILAAEEPSGNLSHVATFDVSSGTASVMADTLVFGGTATRLEITPDGREVVLVAPQDGKAEAYRVSDLSSADDPAGYPVSSLDSGANSLAIAADGTVAVGDELGASKNLFLYYGSNTAMASFGFAPDHLAPDGLAWGADGLSLYAVVQDPSGTYALNTLDNPRLTDTELSFTVGDPGPYPTGPFTASGTLTTKGAVPVGAAIHVSRDGTALPDTTVGNDGTFTFTDVPQQEGQPTYTVSFAGDATHRPAEFSTSVTVVKLQTSIFAPDTVTVTTDSVTFTGTLGAQFNRGTFPEDTTVQVIRRDEATQETVTLPSVPIEPGTGTFTVTDSPGGPSRLFTYGLSYAGDAAHEATSNLVTIRTAQLSPTLTLTAPETAPLGGPLTITGSLSDAPYTGGQQVTVIRSDPEHDSDLIWTAPVGTDGTITITDTPEGTGDNVYTVTYPGDATHRPAETTATVRVTD